MKLEEARKLATPTVLFEHEGQLGFYMNPNGGPGTDTKRGPYFRRLVVSDDGIFPTTVERNNAALLAHCYNHFDEAVEALKLHHTALVLLLSALPKVSLQIDGEAQVDRLSKLIAELEEVKI